MQQYTFARKLIIFDLTKSNYMTLAEQVQVILEQHETELYHRTNGIAPEEYPKIAERIVELFENQNETNETESR